MFSGPKWTVIHWSVRSNSSNMCLSDDGVQKSHSWILGHGSHALWNLGKMKHGPRIVMNDVLQLNIFRNDSGKNNPWLCKRIILSIELFAIFFWEVIWLKNLIYCMFLLLVPFGNFIFLLTCFILLLSGAGNKYWWFWLWCWWCCSIPTMEWITGDYFFEKSKGNIFSLENFESNSIIIGTS